MSPQKDKQNEKQPWKRWLGTALGVLLIALFLYELARTGAWRALGTLPPALFVVVPLIALPILCGTLSWARSFPPGARVPALRVLFPVRLAGEAVNNGLLSAYVAGEPLKALYLAQHGYARTHAFASVLVGKTAFILGEILFLIAVLPFVALQLGAGSPLFTGLALSGAVGAAVCAMAIVLQRQRLVGRSLRLLRAVPGVGQGRLTGWVDAADEIDALVRDTFGRRRGAFARASGWALVGWALGALEPALFLWLVAGRENPWADALVIEAGIAVAKGLGFFVPGALGIQEGGTVWIFEALGLPRETGLVYAVVRRLREGAWILAGLVLNARYLRGLGGGAQRAYEPAALETPACERHSS